MTTRCCRTDIVRPFDARPDLRITRPWNGETMQFHLDRTVTASKPPYLVYHSVCYGLKFEERHCPVCGREGKKQKDE